ncbi:hypothetical protein Ahy_B06g080173 isoform E [Arachis hypogaea]|uniref:Uncharacterized protein n=1 Tax=Arachis hypogaea TaxID=3818 RepID=A0A444YHB1_ARAHY|nr:hypothetical protein Ahy_B06g080173 isoform E [Arachis hypogaea]
MIVREITRLVLESHSMPFQSQQSMARFQEGNTAALGLLKSFLIWSNAFLSLGLHSSENANGESNSSERKHNLSMVSIYGVKEGKEVKLRRYAWSRKNKEERNMDHNKIGLQPRPATKVEKDIKIRVLFFKVKLTTYRRVFFLLWLCCFCSRLHWEQRSGATHRTRKLSFR